MSKKPRVDPAGFAPYAECAWSLIPLHAFDARSTDKQGRPRRDGKRPLDFNWTTRRYDPAQVVRSCVAENRNAGVRLKPDQLVIDVDPRNAGVRGFAKLCRDFGLEPAKWPRVETGSGGSHYYLTKPADLAIVDTLPAYSGVEFKSKGRQVVAAGSIHPDTHRPYFWDGLDHPPLADAPEAPRGLLDAIRRRESSGEATVAGEYTPAQVAAMLDTLDPVNFGEHDKWLRLMMACHHASNGAARSEFIEWSTSDPKYANDADVIGRRWDSLHTDAEAARVTFATLRKFVADEGDINSLPPGDACDDFDSISEPLEDLPQGVDYRSFRHVEAEEIEWLWPGRFAIGKLGLIAGLPADGKSQITLDIAARVSRGDDWPDGSSKAPKGAVIILSSEDDPGDTIKPRLLAAGADVSQCFYASSMVKVENGHRVFNLIDDLARLKLTIDRLRADGHNVLLVICDPVNAYLGGRGKADAWKTSDMRAILTPLKEWAAVVKVAVIGISHFSKHGRGHAIHKIVDSQAITAATRAVWLTADDEAAGRKLFLRGKVNIGRPVSGLAYSIVAEGVPLESGKLISAPRIEWHEAVTKTAEEVLGERRRGPDTEALAECIEFIRSELSDGPKPAKEMVKAGHANGFSTTTLRRAKMALSIASKREGFGPGSVLQWTMPEEIEFEEEELADFG
jgi:hypothetical protein